MKTAEMVKDLEKYADMKGLFSATRRGHWRATAQRLRDLDARWAWLSNRDRAMWIDGSDITIKGIRYSVNGGSDWFNSPEDAVDAALLDDRAGREGASDGEVS